mgnify:CR=1 FL=1
MKARKKLAAFAVAVGVLGGFAGMASAAETITAGGATFPLNLMESCRATFAADSTYNAAGDKVNYTGVGSGTGRTNFYKNDYQFAMSDSLPKTADTSYRSSFVLVPMISGAIGIGYRLDNVEPAGTILQLSSATIAKIFAGQITKWNDAAIVADNPVAAKPTLTGLNGFFAASIVAGKKAGTADIKVAIKKGLITSKTKNLIITATDPTGKVTKVYNKKPTTGIVTITNAKHVAQSEYNIVLDKGNVGTMTLEATAVKLPATPITVYYRKETSGTTNNFANYLNKTQPTIWTKATNDAFTSAFPGTVPTDGSFSAQQGNDGVANGVMNKDGGIGYAEISFINERQSAGKGVYAAKVKNGAGEWSVPTAASAAKFVAAATLDSTAGTVTFDYATTTSGAYPITAVSYGMANTAAGLGTAAQNTAIKNYVDYVVNSCAPAVAEIKGYAALTGAALDLAKAQVAKIGK